ncbi:hypothetical protein ACFSO7_09875 [Bacillus sp. CGMCC 1.16607]|uniref:hypothetical protein n=1 Tax=Bacillus sp. CGMCC 1.16607 TaxID=3351842 RepID=UPI00362CDA66
MLVIATFENSLFIELAISSLEHNGIPKEKIFAAPLDKRTEPRQIFDTIHHADGFSLFDLGAILGTCFMLLGSIYGYILNWGPIIWGIIGAVFGISLGVSLKLWLIKKNKKGNKKISSEIILMVRCNDDQWDSVQNILWNHTAMGLTKINK